MDALGNPLGFHLAPDKLVTPEKAGQLQPLLVGDTLLANKGYDPDRGVIDPLNAEGKSAMISPRHHRKLLRTYDTELYKDRHVIENFAAKRLLYPAIATPYHPSGGELSGVRFFSLLGSSG